MHQPTPRARAWPLAGLLLLTSLASHAAPDGDTLMQKGGANPAAMPCISCHAPDGKGMAAAGFPRLAGLPADYIRKQLHDFKAGRRQNGVMQPIATALTEEEIDALAGAYAARPRVNVAPQPVDTPPEGSGAWIALRGAWDRSIPECTLCHGPGGIGVDPSKAPLFSDDERVEMLEAETRAVAAAAGIEIEVVTFSDLAVTAAHRCGASVIFRGLRDGTDFDYEMQMANMNGQMAPSVQTVFVAASPEVRHIAANLVRQIALMGGDVTPFVSKGVALRLATKVKGKSKR